MPKAASPLQNIKNPINHLSEPLKLKKLPHDPHHEIPRSSSFSEEDEEQENDINENENMNDEENENDEEEEYQDAEEEKEEEKVNNNASIQRNQTNPVRSIQIEQLPYRNLHSQQRSPQLNNTMNFRENNQRNHSGSLENFNEESDSSDNNTSNSNLNSEYLFLKFEDFFF